MPGWFRTWFPAMMACLMAGSTATLRAVELPPGFTAETLVTGINAATAVAVAPDGRVLCAEQTGALRIWKQDRLLPQPALDLSERLDTFWERGLVGFTLDPDFPRSPYMYVVYVAKAPYTHHVVSRFAFLGDTADPASERILLEGDDQKKLGGGVPAGHQGGPICFGADGCLYVGLGEQTHGAAAPRLTTLQGKILRLHPDGTIPTDNPFFNQVSGKYRAIWAIGIRNPFGLALEPGTGRLFETEVGASAFEEVNIIRRGGHYGWPTAEGYSNDPKFVSPVYAYPPTLGRSVCGALFYPATLSGPGRPFPEPWRGRFFFADWADHWIKALDPAQPTNVVTFARKLNNPVGLAAAPDGALWVLNRGTIWRDGKDFKPNSGSLVRIRYQPDAPPSKPVETSIPSRLSETGLFTSLQPLRPREGFAAVTLNAPPWQPGVTTHLYVSLPAHGVLGVDGEGEFDFPDGAVVMQHHLLASSGAPFETQVLWFVAPRTARAGAYRWEEDGRDARLVEDGEVGTLPGEDARRWFSPGREFSLDVDQVVMGFRSPLNVRQVQRDGQLQDWVRRGWLEPAWKGKAWSSVPRLTSWSDTGASLEARVRSYLDANCAVCHRPGGLSRGLFDARFQTPLAEQGLLDGTLASGDLGIAGARVVVPGHPERSILLERLKRRDAARMPPIQLHDEGSPLLPVLEDWIRSLGQ